MPAGLLLAGSWKSALLLLPGKLEGPLFHLGGHEVEGVGAGGGEVLLEAGLIDEGHVGGEDIVGGLSIEDADEKGDHAFRDE